MRVITAFLVAVVVSASPALAGELKWHLWQDVDGIQFGGFVDEMNSIKLIDAEDGNDRRIVYGDRLGLIHVVRFNEGRFQEEWVSPTLKGPIAEVFLEDVNADGHLEILAYTELGEIIMFSAQEYTEIWRSTDDEFDTISAMVLADVDDDPQMEMIFTAESVADVAGYRRTGRGGSPEDAERAREEEISRLYVYDSLFTFSRVEYGTGGDRYEYRRRGPRRRRNTRDRSEFRIHRGCLLPTCGVAMARWFWRANRLCRSRW